VEFPTPGREGTFSWLTTLGREATHGLTSTEVAIQSEMPDATT